MDDKLIPLLAGFLLSFGITLLAVFVWSAGQ